MILRVTGLAAHVRRRRLARRTQLLTIGRRGEHHVIFLRHGLARRRTRLRGEAGWYSLAAQRQLTTTRHHPGRQDAAGTAATRRVDKCGSQRYHRRHGRPLARRIRSSTADDFPHYLWWRSWTAGCGFLVDRLFVLFLMSSPWLYLVALRRPHSRQAITPAAAHRCRAQHRRWALTGLLVNQRLRPRSAAHSEPALKTQRAPVRSLERRLRPLAGATLVSAASSATVMTSLPRRRPVRPRPHGRRAPFASSETNRPRRFPELPKSLDGFRWLSVGDSRPPDDCPYEYRRVETHLLLARRPTYVNASA